MNRSTKPSHAAKTGPDKAASADVRVDEKHEPGKSIADERYEAIKQGDIHIAQLQRCTIKELLQLARREHLSEYTGLKKQDLIF